MSSRLKTIESYKKESNSVSSPVRTSSIYNQPAYRKAAGKAGKRGYSMAELPAALFLLFIGLMFPLLIMASLVEKETAHEEDRPMVASVFVNRLKIGMRLQTDPSVIYGMGARYRGNIAKADLRRDTPYNTYTRAGLTPTPIALPGRAALDAAANPAQSRALYFVAKGDGSGTSQFSETLDEHNAAVRDYILKKGK